MFGPDPVAIYAHVRDLDPVWRKVPKRKPGKKKYEVRVNIDKMLYRSGIGESIESLGFEPKSAKHNKPRYTEDDLTTENVTIKNMKHFKKLTRMMNKDYGHKGWHLRGVRKPHRKLAAIETAREMGKPFAERLIRRGDVTPEEIEKGIDARICVVGDAPTLKRKVFQLELMT